MKQLLLVEDDADARQSLARSLTREGYTVAEASDAESALRLIEQHIDFAVIVSDVVLGNNERGGLLVLSCAKRVLPNVPVILITAYAAVENVKQALNGGAAYLLEKPFRSSELISVIQRAEKREPDVTAMVERALQEASLTEKETVVARLLLKGLTSAEIGRIEENSEKTVRQHISRIYAKCSVGSRAEFFHFVFPW